MGELAFQHSATTSPTLPICPATKGEGSGEC